MSRVLKSDFWPGGSFSSYFLCLVIFLFSSQSEKVMIKSYWHCFLENYANFLFKKVKIDTLKWEAFFYKF